MFQQDSCFILAGERSGEELALSFFPELKSQLPKCHFYGIGGEDLQAAGMELTQHWKDLSTWGLTDALIKLPFYWKLYRKILREIKRRKTKTAILVDFQGLNLALAKKLSVSGVRILYYVAPQAWVWKAWRAKTLAASVHTLFVLLPFEKQWFQERGVRRVRHVSHPMSSTYREEIAVLPKRHHKDLVHGHGHIALLPGSRKSEISRILPYFQKLIPQLLKKNPNLTFHLLKVPQIDEGLYRYFLRDFKIQVWPSEALPELLSQSHLAFAASGTVTLATALFKVPTIVCYELSELNDWAYRAFVSYRGPYSLANIVWEKKVFPELVGPNLTFENLLAVTETWWNEKEQYKRCQELLESGSGRVEGDLKDIGTYMAKVIGSRHT